MLNTLLHEFAHHLDVHLFGWPDTPTRAGSTGGWTTCTTCPGHTTSAALVWIQTGTRWRIDWSKLR
jgi:hypothetical protein